MSLWPYTLQTVTMATGAMTFKLHSSIEDLIVPTFDSLLATEPLVSRVDTKAGTTELESYQFSYIEDYTNYAEGFWYKVLNGEECEIQMLLNEGSGDTHFFWGKVSKEFGEIEEYSLMTGAIGRVGKFTALTLLSRFRGTIPLNVWGELLDHGNSSGASLNWISVAGVAYHDDENTASPIFGHACTLPAFIAYGLKILYNGDSDIDDVILPAAEEFDFSDNEEDSYGLSTCYLFLKRLDALSGDRDSFDTTMAQYQDSLELLSDMCRNVGLVMEYFFDVAEDRHRIRLLSRGRSYAAASTLTAPVKSTFKPSFAELVTNGVAHNWSGLTGYSVRGEYTSGELPQVLAVDFDLNVPILTPFQMGNTNPWVPNTTVEGFYKAVLRGTPYHGTFEGTDWYGYYILFPLNAVRWWDYADQDWTVFDGVFSIDMLAAALKYYYARFATPKRTYMRTYASLKASGAQANMTLMRQTAINDGVSSRNFYATEVSKNPFTGELYVQWVEV